MKTFDHHEPCPNCGSKDNVGVWSDGQKYCFTGCGYFVSGSNGLNIEDIKGRLEQEKEKDHTGATVGLPADYSLLIPSKPLAWLKKYGITDAERFRYKIGWSEIYESLIYPCFDLYGNLIIIQRRYFGQDAFPRFNTKGSVTDSLWTARPFGSDSRDDPCDTYNGTLIIVEDFISALKIGRRHEALPLFGSNIPLRRLKSISDRWEEVIIWLDFDKAQDAIKYRITALPFFNDVGVVVTDKDPKDYDDKFIADTIHGAIIRHTGD